MDGEVVLGWFLVVFEVVLGWFEDFSLTFRLLMWSVFFWLCFVFCFVLVFGFGVVLVVWGQCQALCLSWLPCFVFCWIVCFYLSLIFLVVSLFLGDWGGWCFLLVVFVVVFALEYVCWSFDWVCSLLFCFFGGLGVVFG